MIKQEAERIILGAISHDAETNNAQYTRLSAVANWLIRAKPMICKTLQTNNVHVAVDATLTTITRYCNPYLEQSRVGSSAKMIE